MKGTSLFKLFQCTKPRHMKTGQVSILHLSFVQNPFLYKKHKKSVPEEILGRMSATPHIPLAWPNSKGPQRSSWQRLHSLADSHSNTSLQDRSKHRKILNWESSFPRSWVTAIVHPATTPPNPASSQCYDEHQHPRQYFSVYLPFPVPNWSPG